MNIGLELGKRGSIETNLEAFSVIQMKEGSNLY